jgi:hypothetical protein
MNPQIVRVAFLFAVFALSSAFAKSKSAPPVIFVSPCECQGAHGADRWTPKTDPTSPPPFGIGVPTVTPSQIYQWKGPGPNVPLTKKTETRLSSEQKWYKLKGRIVDIRVEADGDIHVMLQDATGNKTGRVGAEVPVGPLWCKIRQNVFSWTHASFPFTIKSNKVFKIIHPHVITVTGKAFYDVDHAPADHSNRSTIHEKTAAWEIHPVRGLHVDQ